MERCKRDYTCIDRWKTGESAQAPSVGVHRAAAVAEDTPAIVLSGTTAIVVEPDG